jgi:hypothetical protein
LVILPGVGNPAGIFPLLFVARGPSWRATVPRQNPESERRLAMEYEKIIAELLTIPGVLGLPDQGDYFEAALVHTHYQYLEERRGLIVKLGVPIRGTGRGSRRAFHGSKTLCDFVGWVLNSVYTHDDELIVRPAYPRVVPIAFDAKRRDVSGSRGWKWRYGDVSTHQHMALRLVELMGGWGFLLVSIEEDEYLLNEVRVIKASQLQPGTGVDLRECPKVELGLQRCDWLPVIREMYEQVEPVE